jgi:hypothetical protein
LSCDLLRASGLPRIPAAELESAVVEQIRGLLKATPITQQVAAIANKNGPSVDEAQVTIAFKTMPLSRKGILARV